MKRCMYCGQENDDTNTTCVKCGNPLLDTPPQEGDALLESAEQEVMPEQEAVPQEVDVEPAYEEQAYSYEEYPPEDETSYEYEEAGDAQYGGQAYGYEEPQEYGEAPYEQRGRVMPPLMRTARKRVKSFLFLLPTLLFTVYIVANIINIALSNTITNLSTVSNTLAKNFGTSSALTLFNTVIGLLNNVNPWILVAVQIALMIPQILLLFGLWGMFTGTSRRRVSVSTSGYSLARGSVILQFIIACAALLMVIVLTVSFVVAAGASGSTMSLIIGVILLLVVVIVAVLAIMFYIQVIYSLKLIKINVRTGEDYGRIPGYAIFMGILVCLLSVAAMLPMAPDDYIGLTAKGAFAAWMLFISFWAMIYRASVKVK